MCIFQNKIQFIGGNDIKDGCQNLWIGAHGRNVAFYQNNLVEKV
jgi:hypothetical protein